MLELLGKMPKGKLKRMFMDVIKGNMRVVDVKEEGAENAILGRKKKQLFKEA